MEKIVLASKSPRRRELLSQLFCDFDVIVKDVDEALPEWINIREGTELLAIKKGKAVADTLPWDYLIISSDTLVELDGMALGKPVDKSDAYKMLTSLSGRAHNVHTGVAVHYRGECYSGVATTGVYFRPLTDKEILDYIDTGEPMDKAGAYGIQGLGGAFVERFDGDFDTVVGLSLALTKELIESARRRK